MKLIMRILWAFSLIGTSLLTISVNAQKRGTAYSWSACQKFLEDAEDQLASISPDTIEALRQQGPLNLGLPGEDMGVEIQTPSDINKLSPLADQLPPYVIHELRLLSQNGRFEDVAPDEVLYINRLGISRWRKGDLRKWKAGSAFFARQRSNAQVMTWEPADGDAKDWMAGLEGKNGLVFSSSATQQYSFFISGGKGSVQGFDDEMVANFRVSFGWAKQAWEALIAHPRQPGRSTHNPFRSLYNQIRLNDRSSNSIKLALPWDMDPESNDLRISAQDATHLATVAFRSTLVRKLIRVSDNKTVYPAVNRQQRYFAATFPELMPFLSRYAERGPFEKPDHLIERSGYAFFTGNVQPFSFEPIVFHGLNHDLPEIHLGALIFKLSLIRNIKGDESRLLPLDFMLQVDAHRAWDSTYRDYKKEDLDRVREQTEKKLNMVVQSVASLKDLNVILQPNFLPDTNSIYPRRSRPLRFQIRLQGSNVTPSHLLHMFLLFDELSKN